MIQKKRINNDVFVRWGVFTPEGFPVDLTEVTSMTIEARPQSSNGRYPMVSEVVDNFVEAYFLAKDQKVVGKYNLYLTYTIDDPNIIGGVATYTIDYCDAFELLPKSCFVDGEDDVDPVNIQGIIASFTYSMLTEEEKNDLASRVSSNSGAQNLSDLLDVTISNLEIDQILKYDGTKWVNATPTGGSSSNVSWGIPTSQYTPLIVNGVTRNLSLNNHTHHWDTITNRPLTDAQFQNLLEIADLWKLDNDGNLYTERNVYSHGWISEYNWGESPTPPAGVYNLKDLLDVGIINPQEDNILRFNGSHWVNVPSSNVGTLVEWSSETDNYVNLLVGDSSKSISLHGHKHEIDGINNLQDSLDFKQDNIPLGDISQYYRGDKEWAALNTDTVVEATNLYYTPERVIELTEDLYAKKDHTHAFNSLTGLPNTLDGYGIIDAYNKTEIDNLISSTSGFWVKSVGLEAPTGFTVSDSPIIYEGNIKLSFASGYSLPSNSKQYNWDLAFSDRHIHTNISVLNELTIGDVNNWNSIQEHLNDYNNPHQVSFRQLNNKPSTLLGYGITDVYNKTEVDYIFSNITPGESTIKNVYGYDSIGQSFSNDTLSDTFNAYTISRLYDTLTILAQGNTNLNTIINWLDADSHNHPNKEVLDTITQEMLDNALHEMLGVDSLEEATDENFFSALRTLAEIIKNNESLKALFLSKVDDDTAQGLIKFVKGLEIGDYTTGFLGGGGAFKMNNGISELEVDKLTVRMIATFFELVISKLRHIGGQFILTPASMKCIEVEVVANGYKCFFDRGDNNEVVQEFVVNDQARCQVFSGSGMKMYWRLVVEVGDDYIVLSDTDKLEGSSIPEAGDDIAQLGNATDTTRQNAQILATVGVDAPSWKQYKGINSFSLEGKDTTVFSGTGNKIDGKTVFTSNGANVEDGINSKNSNYSSQPTSYKANDTWTLSSDTTVNGISYKSGEILTATQDSTTYNQAHWLKRVRYTDDTAIDNLEIGGRNLLINSSWWGAYEPFNTVPIVSNNGRTISFIKNAVGSTAISKAPLPYKADGSIIYTFSGIAKADGVPVTNTTWGANKTANTFQPTPLRFLLDDTTGRFEITQKWTVENQWMLHGVIFPFPTGTVITIDDFKIEKGNKATDWTPAPEDVQAEIDGLGEYMEGTFEDGVIDKAEAKAIAEHLKTIGDRYVTDDALYYKLIDNPYLKGSARSTLQSVMQSQYRRDKPLLDTAINNIVSNGKVTTSLRNAFNTAFTNYTKSTKAYQEAVEEARKAIEEQRVADIEVGGRNYFSINDFVADNKARGYSTINVINYNGNTAYRSSSIINNHNIPRYLQGKFEANTQYYLQFKINWESYTNSGAQYIFQIRYTDGTLSNLYATTSQTSRSMLTASGKTIDYITTTRQYDGTVVIYEVQIEKGNKASDWTPALEDTDRELLEAQGYMRARYIRDYIKGSSANNTNHWNELKVFNKAGVNIAIGKIPTSNGVLTNPANLTDNILNNFTHIQTPTTPTSQYIQIDLGQVHYDIDYIHVWHYYLDGRTYNGTKTQISEDGITWKTIFDSAVSGTYAETEGGKVHTQRYASVMDRITETEAKTRFQTLIDGGLIYTALMKLFDTISGDETAFISGKQGAGKNLPAFGAGGSYQDALAGTAKAIIRHDGTSKFSDTEITGVINANSGIIEKLTMAPSGVIELPPTFTSRKGRIDNSGIQLVYDGSNSQSIEWYTGLGTYSGRIAPNSQGHLSISSSFGVGIQSQLINIGTEALAGNINIGSGLAEIDFNGSSINNIKEVTNIGYTSMASLTFTVPNNTSLTLKHDTPLSILTSVGSNSFLKSIYMNNNNLLRDGTIKWILNRATSNLVLAQNGNIRMSDTADTDWIIKSYSFGVFIYYGGYWYKHNDHR